MRQLYTLIWCLLVPFVVIRLFFLSRKNPEYRQRIPERFGFCNKISVDKRIIWIHAVSVGETQAAIPLVRSLQEKYPRYRILITTITPTGAAHVVRNFQESVEHCYLPYDLPVCIQLFLTRVQPLILLVMETELWPNLFHLCHSHSIPVAVINARLSERSARRYGLFPRLTREMLKQISIIACRNSADADQFKKLGVSGTSIKVTGNIKFDLELSVTNEDNLNEARENLFGNRPVWIAASTHAGEEAIVLRSHQLLLESIPNALLVLAPRHPERCREVNAIIKKQGLVSVNHSSGDDCPEGVQVYLLDTLGELHKFYGMVDVVFMGGSLVETGGHNYLEPAANGRAILTGSHFYNFREIAEQLLTLQAARLVCDETDLSRQLTRLFEDRDERNRMGERARKFLKNNRGSTAKIMQLISPWLD